MFIHIVENANGDIWPKCYLSEERAKAKARKLKGSYYTLELSFKGFRVH